MSVHSAAAILLDVKFRTTVILGGKTATGLPVPDDVVAALDAGKRPKVRVTIGRHTYRTTVAPMGGQFFVPLSAENRAAAGVIAGDEVDVAIDLDSELRAVQVPDDFAVALDGDDVARSAFDRLSYTHRKEWVRWIEDAKREETRIARIDKAVVALRAGQRTR
jgi:Bacteriocin-protection, YdeI or OmpD-Associated/Domain of unknown function (DUF1905)